MDGFQRRIGPLQSRYLHNRIEGIYPYRHGSLVPSKFVSVLGCKIHSAQSIELRARTRVRHSYELRANALRCGLSGVRQPGLAEEMDSVCCPRRTLILPRASERPSNCTRPISGVFDGICHLAPSARSTVQSQVRASACIGKWELACPRPGGKILSPQRRTSCGQWQSHSYGG